MDTIAIYYTPLTSTKVAEVVGLGEAYHMALVYTDGAGRSFGASSGPSNHMTAQTPGLAISAAFASTMGIPSAFGTLVSDPKNTLSPSGDRTITTRRTTRATPTPPPWWRAGRTSRRSGRRSCEPTSPSAG